MNGILSNPKSPGGSARSAAKEMLSLAFLKALLAKKGLNYSSLAIDDNGIDITIYGKDFSGIWPSPEVKIQLKCTSNKSYFDFENGIIKFPLKKFNYNKLVQPSPMPAILVVHHCPEEPCSWVTETNYGNNIRLNSYWFSLRGMPEISTQTKTVYIPMSQKLDSDSIMSMLEKASNGIDLVNIEREVEHE